MNIQQFWSDVLAQRAEEIWPMASSFPAGAAGVCGRSGCPRERWDAARCPGRCYSCGAAGAWQTAGNDAFKAYRREYKRRFAWIKAGRITDQQFYDWSERAGAQKKKYDEGAITLEDFRRWPEAS